MTFSEFTKRNSLAGRNTARSSAVPTFGEWAEAKKASANENEQVLSALDSLRAEYERRKNVDALEGVNGSPKLDNGLSYVENAERKKSGVYSLPFAANDAGVEANAAQNEIRRLENQLKRSTSAIEAIPSGADSAGRRLKIDPDYLRVKESNPDVLEQLQAKRRDMKTAGYENAYKNDANRDAAVEAGRVPENKLDVLRAFRDKDNTRYNNTSVYSELEPEDVKSGYKEIVPTDLTADEINVYNYWYGKDPKKAEDYLESIRERVNKRSYEKEFAEKKAYTKEHPVGGAALNIASGFATPFAAVGALKDKVAGRPYNPYSPLNNGVMLSDATSEGLTEDIKSPLARFLASTGLSTAQFLAKLPLGGSSLALTALGSAGQTMNDAKQRGANTDQAIKLGVIAGAAEAAFEKIPLENILKAFKGTAGNGVGSAAVRSSLKGLIKGEISQELSAVLGSAVEEGMEEYLTDIVNNIADYAIMGDKSEYEQYKKQLMEAGYDETLAGQKALAKFTYIDPLISAAGGALSGGAMAGAGVAWNNRAQIAKGINDTLVGDGSYFTDKIKPTAKAVGSTEVNTPKVNTDVNADVNRNIHRRGIDTEVTAVPESNQNTVKPEIQMDTVENAISNNLNTDSNYSDLETDPDVVTAEAEMPEIADLQSAEPRKPVRSLGDLKLNETYVSGMRAGATAEDIDLAQLIGKTFGRKVLFSSEAGINGRYDGDTIYINPKASDTAPTVLAHELLHSVEGSAGYEGVIESLKQVAAARGQDWESIVSDIWDQYSPKYQSEGRQLTDADCEAEAAANIISSILGDEKTLTDFVRQNRSAAARMWTHLKRAVKRLGENIGNKFGYTFAKNGEERQAYQEKMYAQTLRRITEDACDKLAEALRKTRRQATQTTNDSAGGKYSFAEQKIPSYDELIQKPDMKIIDIGAEDYSRSFKEQRKSFMSSEEAARLYSEPVVNIDTGEKVFITPASLTHTFSNDARYKLQTVEHIREIIENAVLTHSETSTHGADNTTGVYTLFAAVRTDKGVQPVKVKIKEYLYTYRDKLPQHIASYFGKNGAQNPYSSVYDGRVLELDSIEPVQKMPTATNLNPVTVLRNSDYSARYKHPSSGNVTADTEAVSASTISIADFLPLVNSEYQKYLPESGTKFSLDTESHVSALDSAKRMEAEGRGMTEIKSATGWYRDESGKWKKQWNKQENMFDAVLPREQKQSGVSEATTEVSAKKASLDETTAKAKAHFGTTYDWNKTGYLLTDGTRLDFSGKHEGYDSGMRSVDHRDIDEIYDGVYQVDALLDFMQKGNIRIMPESGSINLSTAPTAKQETALRQFIRRWNGEVMVDIDDSSGKTVKSFEYDAGTSSEKILGDIRRYTSGQADSESDVAKFHNMGDMYSLDTDKEAKSTHKSREEAAMRAKAIDMLNNGVDADKVYDQTGWYYNELGKLSIDRAHRLYSDNAQSSQSTDKEAQVRNYLAELQSENAGLTDMMSTWISPEKAEEMRQSAIDETVRSYDPNLKKSPDYMPSREQAKKIVNEITSDNHTQKQKNKFLKEILDIYDRASETDSNGTRAMSEKEIADAFYELATEILDSDMETDTNIINVARQIKRELHTPVFLSEKARGDISEGYGKFRKQYFGKINLVSRGKGTPVDSRYMELSSAYPDWFPDDIWTESEQIYKMAEVYDRLSDPDLGKSSVYNFGGWEQVYKEDRLRIIKTLFDGLRNMEKAPKTAVDRVLMASERKERLTEDAHKKLMDNLVAEMTKDFQDDLKETREYYETLDANKELIHQEEIKQTKEHYEKKEQDRLDREAKAKAEKALRRHRRGGDIDRGAIAEARQNGKYAEKMQRLYDAQTELSREFEPYAQIDIDKIEDKEIRKHAKELKERLEDMSAYVNRVGQITKDIRRDEALAMLSEGDYYSWKDKPSGILYSIETMPRNIRDISKGDALGEKIIAKYFEPVSQDVARGNRLKKQYRDKIRELNISQKAKKGDRLSESKFIQLWGEAESNIEMLESDSGTSLIINGEPTRAGHTLDEWKGILDTLTLENPGIANKEGMERVRKAVDVFRKCYNELLPEINKARIMAGYAPIEYHAGYFPHFSNNQGDGVMTLMLQAMGATPGDVGGLPTSINGLTGTFRPGIRYMSNAKSRNLAGDGGQFTGAWIEDGMGAIEGFEQYLNTAADVITLTDDIQNLRALSNAIRYSGAPEGVKKQFDMIRQNESLTTFQRESLLESLFDGTQPYRLRNFVVELEEYTNILAGKRSMRDRSAEQEFGRGMYNLVKRWESRVAANMVAINPGSWLTNFSPLVQGGAVIKQRDMLMAMVDTLKAVKNDDGFRSRSDFLTNRFADDSLVDAGLGEKLSKTLSTPMEKIDRLTSEILVRARYAQNLKKGLSETDALHEADMFTAGLMAGRSKGEMPTLFERRNPIAKLFTQFQLEVNNQVSWMCKDLLREAKGASRFKTVKKMAGMLLKYSFGAWLFNEVYEAIVGRRCAFDPADILLGDVAGDIFGYGAASVGKLWEAIKDVPDIVLGKKELGEVVNRTFKRDRKSVVGTAGDLVGGVLESMPFTSIGGLFNSDFDQGRIPVSAAMLNLTNLVKAGDMSNGYSKKKRGDLLLGELAKLVYYTAFPFGGGQIKKVVEGTDFIARGGSYKPDKEGKPQLQYPLYNDNALKTVTEAGKALVFGKTSTEGGKEWVDNGFKRESAKATEAYQIFEKGGMTRREALEAVHSIKDAQKRADKVKALRDCDAESDAKRKVFLKLIAGESKEGSTEQTAQEKRVALIKQAGIDFDDYLDVYLSYLNNNGLGKKKTVVEDIQKMKLTNEQKDTLFLCFYKEATLKDTPWHNVGGMTMPMLPEFELPELPDVQIPEIKMP